ncbi:hypothetical protein ACFSGY_31885, partial [Rhizobium viscosum]|uniref:hypothetical protein n=1 Tax=Rhizobium viscosum TaxID=1673 RepID=UPI0036377D5D
MQRMVQLICYAGDGRQDMLAIVKNEKLVPAAQRVNETFHVIDRVAYDAERTTDGQGDELPFLDRGQVNE